MSSVQPSRTAIDARAAARGEAAREVESGLRLDSRRIAASVGDGVERVERIVAPGGRCDAGWALLFTGVLLTLRGDTGSLAEVLTSDPTMRSGLMLADYLSSAVGDRLLSEDEQREERTAADVAWQPASGAEAAIVLRSKAVEQSVATSGPGAKPTQRLAARVIAGLEEVLVGLDKTAAGWALSAFGGWLSIEGSEAARAIGRPRVLGRRNQKAQNGCSLGGQIITSVGTALLADGRP